MVAYELATFAATLLSILIGGTSVSTDNTTRYYVKPNDTSPCPYHPCKTLAEYALDPGQYFTSDTRIIFLPGNHSLNTTLVVGNVTRLALVGKSGHVPALTHTTGVPQLPPESASIINCTANISGLFLENITHLVLTNLMFKQCGNVRSTPYCNHSALTLISITHMRVSGISIHNSSGLGFCGQNLLGNTIIENSVFAGSCRNNTRNIKGVNMLLLFSNCSDSIETNHLLVLSSYFLFGSNDPLTTRFSASGLVVVLECTNVAVVIDNSTFLGNKGGMGGNVRITFHNYTNSFIEPVVIQNCTIMNGTADEGGGMHISVVEQPQVNDINCSSVHHIHILNTKFSGNTATYIGGGLYFAHLQSANSYCASLRALIWKCVFMHNTRHLYMTATGIALHISNHHIPGYLSQGVPQAKIEIENCTFSNNTDKTDQGVSAAVYVEEEFHVSISDSIFLSNNCTAITAVNSEILFGGSITIRGNNGSNGGGIVLCDRSHMYFKPYTSLFLADNRASERGGAIYAEEDCLQAKPTCFFQIVTEIAINHELLETVNVTVMNNSAVVAGDAVYGGSIDYCYLLFEQHIELRSWTFYTTDVFNTIFNPHVQPSDISFISSDPAGVCFCDNGKPICNQKSRNFPTYPGRTVGVSAVVVGQRDGTVPGVVVAAFENATIEQSERHQSILTHNCTVLNYTAHSLKSLANLTLNVVPSSHHFEPVVVTIHFHNCPLGFTFTHGKCECNSSGFKLTCDINNPSGPTIIRHEPEWIGYDHETKLVLYRNVCPLDFCKPYDVNISTDNSSFKQDVQCAFNRTGILCGQCTGDLSHALGSDSCIHCSSFYLVLLIPFAIAGLLLVLLIAVCNLTVTDGSINGLIFYANVVQVSITVFLPISSKQSLAGVLTVLISWLNLDLGIETCFYNGLDVYAKTWLQFAFPVYLWVIASVIVYLSRRIAFFAQLMGKNGVQVLATLLYLSYAKLLAAVIAALTCGFVFRSDGSKMVVWVYDGNLQYLHGKHIPLFAAAVMFGLISRPFVLLLLYVKCFQRMSNRKLFLWVHRLKPLIDAYTGPYKDESRFWMGLLLFVRDFLFIAHALNLTGDAQTNLILTVLTCVLLLWAFGLVNGGPYKLKKLNILESLFILNLGALCIGTTYFLGRKHHRNQRLFASAMVSLAILQFLVFLLHRGYKSLQSSPVCSRVMWWVTTVRHSETVQEPVTVVYPDNETPRDSTQGTETQMIPCCQTPFDQYREPLLASISDDSD